MFATVCAPSQFPLRRITRCPTCQRRRRFAAYDVAWYGPTWICCGCGDSWTDGERHPRPFRPRWRKEAIADARRIWNEAGQFTKAQWREWMNDQLHGAA